ncbi:MAG: PQQ-dependent sugar dehydrogenase [Acidimicrobiia bacterium]
MRARIALVGVSLLLTATPAAAATSPGGSFIDDDGSTHEPAIEAIRTAGITEGCDPVGDRFCPTDAVTRAEMAAFVVRAVGETPLGGVPQTFQDVEPSQWYFGAVERAVALGITVGYGDGTFRPNASVTRAEMAVFVVRALGEPPVEQIEGVFADVASDSFSAGAVERLWELDVTRGCAASPLRFCPAAAVTRAEMASFLARGFALPQEPVPARPSIDGLSLTRTPVAEGFDQPVFVTAPARDDRLFIVEKGGAIRVLEGGEMAPEPFLDITDRVSTNGERGLLGLAFHPAFASNGRLFVHYTDPTGANRVVEYAANGGIVDPDSAHTLLTVPQPASNHNGGMIAFGPDGRLYVGIGDGGGSFDPFGHGQNPDSPLGAITALDTDTGATSLFAYGLRNPWRFAWDGDRMYIGDVGQSSREEIDVVSVFQPGANFGWSRMEGSLCLRGGCAGTDLVLPVAEYSHSQGCSVTGGYVYRGTSIPAAAGHYFYGDFCSGRVWSFRYTGQATEHRSWQGLATDGLVSFGVDGHGELYLVSIQGSVWRVTP